MSIVHAAIVPEMNDQFTEQEHIKKYIQEIEGELYFMKPDTLVVLQTTSQEDDCITVSVSDGIKDSDGRVLIRNDIKLVMNMKAEFNKQDHQQWLYLDANETVDAPILRSIVSLTEHTPNIKYVHIQLPLPSEKFPLADTTAAAYLIGSVLLGSDDRISFIALTQATDGEKDFYNRLQKGLVQKNISELSTQQGVGAVGSFETTVRSFVTVFHGTQFEPRILTAETIENSHIIIADMSMS